MGSLFDNLPSAESPALILTTATPDEAIECQRINGSSWKGPLTEDQYLRREHHLAQQDLTKDGGLTCWILVDRNEEPSRRTIFSSCETVRKIGLVATKPSTASNADDATVREVTVHGIGSVFCRREFRGRRYASRMMTELGKVLDTWQQGEAGGHKGLFSVLYSDIGKMFYAQHGWKPAESAHITLPPITRAEYDERRAELKLPVVTELEAEDLEGICEKDVRNVSTLLAREASQMSMPVIAIAPDYPHMSWHHARENYLAAELFDQYPRVKGAQTTSDGRSKSFCIWTRTFGTPPDENVLHFLRLSSVDICDGATTTEAATALAALLLRAQLEASDWHMQSVEIWNPNALTVLAAQNILPDTTVVEREEYSIASIKWNGKEQGLAEGFCWSQNEKYGWC